MNRPAWKPMFWCNAAGLNCCLKTIDRLTGERGELPPPAAGGFDHAAHRLVRPAQHTVGRPRRRGRGTQPQREPWRATARGSSAHGAGVGGQSIYRLGRWPPRRDAGAASPGGVP